MKKYLYIILSFVLVACSKEDWNHGSEGDMSLLGRAVSFATTWVDEFTNRTKASYDDKGVFNENDMMRIFRQYKAESEAGDADKDGWEDDVAYRTYYYNTKYATGTSISLGTDWKVYPKRKGRGFGDNPTLVKEQSEADSLTWDNGKTVRFRAWARSNYAGVLSSCQIYSDGRTNYYPDFSMSDWVTVSGPTESIPLAMRHMCSRIVIAYRNNGSQLYKVEIATDWHDYKRGDNADSSVNDGSAAESGKTDAQAQEECNRVLAAYNRMCMPAGVDVDKAELYAMTKSFWNSAKKDTQLLQKLEEAESSVFYHFDTQNAAYIIENVQRPIFGNVNNYCYLLTIPYDMSNEATHGEIINLPACTRFRVYMRDVNNGDGALTDGYEGTYHIFSLSDIVDGNKVQVFPNGLDMLPGYSYRFNVGYRYNQLTITANDNFSWVKQDLEDENFTENVVPIPESTAGDYAWWKKTIKDAIPTGDQDFNPVFRIDSTKAFLEFIKLVNGTATTKTSGLYRAKRKEVNPEHASNPYDRKHWWYTEVSPNKRDTTWITTAEATAQGYIFYESYSPANGNQAAYSQEEYLRGAYPFFDETRNRRYTVYLNIDLDLSDWELPSIGNSVVDPETAVETRTPFKGYFDGQMHTLSNVNLTDEYLFKYIDGAAIRNLKIESTHKVSLVKEGTNTCYIIGIDLRAHSTLNPIAESLTTNEYNNPSYVVGCIHVGDAGGALIGASGYLYMYGCMHAAEGIGSAGDGLQKAALVGKHLAYTSTSNWKFLTPQKSFDYNVKADPGNPSWGRFMCNYFDTELSPDTWAVGDLELSAAKDYSPLEYIRGRESFILKAKNDNLLKGDVTFKALNSYERRMAYYGLAPWKAMNYAIYRFNSSSVGTTHPCNAHYVNNSTGYVHRYPELIGGVPAAGQYANPLEQKN